MPMSFPESEPDGWWQDRTFFTLCAGYAIVSCFALIQLIRIELRIPEYGWTTPKVFLLMNFIVNGVHAIVFGFHSQVFLLHSKVLTSVTLHLPVLLFFSTYTFLLLFWAEMYHQSRDWPADNLKTIYLSINGAIYFIQVCIWVYLGITDNSAVESIGRLFIAGVSLLAAFGYLLYGGRLFFMLKQFPVEFRGRNKKLHEVGYVSVICITCFLIRCFVVGLSAFDSDASLNDALDHPVFNLIFYTLVGILPSGLVMYILRQLVTPRQLGCIVGHVMEANNLLGEHLGSHLLATSLSSPLGRTSPQDRRPKSNRSKPTFQGLQEEYGIF